MKVSLPSPLLRVIDVVSEAERSNVSAPEPVVICSMLAKMEVPKPEPETVLRPSAAMVTVISLVDAA